MENFWKFSHFCIKRLSECSFFVLNFSFMYLNIKKQTNKQKDTFTYHCLKISQTTTTNHLVTVFAKHIFLAAQVFT